MSFTISFDTTEVGKFISNILSDETMQTVRPDISIAFLKLHETLVDRVAANYNAPFSLDRVFSGVDSRGKEGFSMKYYNKSISLARYPHKEFEVKLTKPNKIPFAFANGWVNYTPITTTHRTVSTIRRAGSKSLPRQRTKYSKFYAPKTGKIFVRLQDATWSKIPSELDTKGKRAPIKELFGPTLSTLARITYDFDPKMEVARETLATDVLNAVTKAYKSR